MFRPTLILASLVLLAHMGQAQQNAGPDFHPPIGKPAYESGRGPRVAIDGAHDNFHTGEGTYRPFADLLRRDGYRVAGLTAQFTGDSLREVDLLVIVSATGPRDVGRAASAFTDAEVDAVDRWLRGGRALLLVADHEPWPAAAAKLASRLGVEFKNAYVYDGPEGRQQGTFTFRKTDKGLAAHAVTEGVESVGTFLGSAFRITGPHVPLLRLSPAAVARPTMGNAPAAGQEPVGGWLQGALLEHGSGRAGVFAEAAMFTAQVRGGRGMGMNTPEGAGNPQFLLNVVRWLTRAP
jgi:hypothetical protein